MNQTMESQSFQSVCRVGITGGIASGKSLVGTYLIKQGIPVLDTDQVVHQLYQTDAELNAQILDTFGPGVLGENKQVDRVKLGDIVFKDATKLRLLESWIHPKVRLQVVAFFEQHQQEPLAAVLIPLLFESNLERFFDQVWLVVASPEQQIERMITYRHLTESEAQLRLSKQLSLEEKKKRTPYWIDNTGTMEQTYAAIDARIKAVLSS